MRSRDLPPPRVRLELVVPRTVDRDRQRRAEVRGLFAGFGMVDATDLVTRPAEDWEVR